MCRIYEGFQIGEYLDFTAPHKCYHKFKEFRGYYASSQVIDFVDSNPGKDSNA